MNKFFRFTIFSVFFALCCVFVFFVSSFKGISLSANTNEITQEEIIEEENQDEIILEENEPLFENEKLNELSNWIVSLIVSFLGSSLFYFLAKLIIKGSIKELKNKVLQLEEDKKLSEESKKQYENKIDELEKILLKYTENNQILINYIQTKIKVDEEKVKKTNELLSNLLPKNEVLKNETNEE